MARTTLSPPRTSRRSPPAQRHSSSSTPTTTTATNTNTTTTSSRPLALQRAAERPNVPIAPASSNTSSPIYSTTSSPPISPGVSQYPSTTTITTGTMAPSRSDSRTTALALELPPTSTPTGRISKAKKGKRVHACEFPGCGKVFTRAEHRRRHELNHNPDATYRCSQQGCGKSFHRLDLLQRHQERHELEASTQPSSPNRRYPTQSAVLAEPPNSMPTTSMASPQVPQPAPRNSAGGMSIPSIMNHSAYHPQDPASAFGLNQYPYYFSSAESWDPTYVTDNTHSPHSRGYHRPSVSATSSVVGFDHNTGSPMVSAAMPQTSWTPAPPPNVLPQDMFENGMSPYRPSATVNSTPIPLSDLDGHEWSFIGRELSNVPGLLSSLNGSGVPDTLRWHCFDKYWQCFHPTYPIVHRPTFLISTKPPPLLSCAMVAIGSYYDTSEDAKRYSLALLEIATKILRQRPSSTSKNHRSRIVDLQTVVLLEILSTFCARQISVQMSARFRSLFANLNQQLSITSPLAVFRSQRGDRSPAKLAEGQKFWMESETRSRILHACSVLDSQQSILFEQQPIVRRHLGNTNIRQVNLPCNDDLWDADSLEKWAAIAEKHEYVQLVGGRPATAPGRQTQYSYFQQQVINANSNGVLKCLPSTKTVSVSSDQILSKSEFDYHTAWMCKYTRIRSLLMVTGESWLLGRKVEKQADYQHAQRELRKWIEGSPTTNQSYSESSAAHWHALKLLRILQLEGSERVNSSQVFGTTNMLHENWVVYLACLVCWAHGQRRSVGGMAVYGMQRTSGTSKLVDVAGKTIPATNGLGHDATTAGRSCLNDALLAAQEAETYLLFTDVSSPAAVHDLDPAILGRTQGLLESVRTQKISKHMMGGLMNDAEQVLLKLVQGKSSNLF